MKRFNCADIETHHFNIWRAKKLLSMMIVSYINVQIRRRNILVNWGSNIHLISMQYVCTTRHQCISAVRCMSVPKKGIIRGSITVLSRYEVVSRMRGIVDSYGPQPSCRYVNYHTIEYKKDGCQR
jgi:hypothetical protein